ncbi:MAG: divalent-cation tolerance protein CutA [Burkholderiales bacterium]|nr:divalent-cation tolerance protein CutA [Burkholderiales bacterium]
MEPLILLISNFPDRDSALRLAHALLERRLAACVNLLAPCTSLYRWKDALETAEEIPVLIKTRASLYAAVQDEVCRLHPYEVPELLALPVTTGLPAYLTWVEAETVPASEADH